jgi:hypothetical protein
MTPRVLSVMAFLCCCYITTLAQDSGSDSKVMSPDDEVYMGVSTPTFMPIGGYSSWSLDGAADFEPSIMIGAVFGFQGDAVLSGSTIVRSQSGGLYLMYHMAGETKPTTNAVSAFRFGLQSRESYGYSFNTEEKTGVYFVAGKAPLSWYSITVDNGPAGLAGAGALMNFPGSLRFGESATAGLDFRIAGPVAISLNYEWAQVYERHMFWYWATSALIEGVADGLAGWFVRAIGNRSKGALPIMHFILRNGVSMGFKALRMDQMNWPINTAAPLNVMTYSVGVNIIF